MTTIQEIMQAGVGVPDLAKFESFTQDMLGLPTNRSPLDDVMRSYHFLRMRQAPIGMGPGRHINCQTVHVYVQTPAGFAVEFGWGHRRLDGDHQPVVYPAGSPVDIWSGDIQSPEFEIG